MMNVMGKRRKLKVRRDWLPIGDNPKERKADQRPNDKDEEKKTTMRD